MSTGTASGIAYVTMYDDHDGVLSDGEQFSGVLIAPDELLTSAHGVVSADGTVRDYGTAYLGYAGGDLPAGDAVTAVHVLDATHRSGVDEGETSIASDFAVLKLATPVADATTFALGLGEPGSYLLTGYPAAAGGSPVTVSEDFAMGGVAGDMYMATILGSTSGAGASGGPVYRAGGAPTVVGLYTAEDATGRGYATALTQADVAQIRRWMASDHATDGTDRASTVSAPSEGAFQAAYDPGRMSDVAALIAGDSASASGARATTMADVSRALQAAAGAASPADGATGLLAGLRAVLRTTSEAPKRAMAFAAGVLAGEGGASAGEVRAYAADVLGIDLVSPAGRAWAAMGYTEDRSTSASTAGVGIDALGAAIGGRGDAVTPDFGHGLAAAPATFAGEVLASLGRHH